MVSFVKSGIDISHITDHMKLKAALKIDDKYIYMLIANLKRLKGQTATGNACIGEVKYQVK